MTQPNSIGNETGLEYPDILTHNFELFHYRVTSDYLRAHFASAYKIAALHFSKLSLCVYWSRNETGRRWKCSTEGARGSLKFRNTAPEICFGSWVLLVD
ncbi:hypothetical protein TNCV_3896741 [Trichonephila clavipes]|nr:hypothetical protein TNCV_3896741 [Trichonephila clavipes]